MENVDKRLERLMIRRLDGEINDEEALELDKALIRDPQARAVYEDYARIDLLAAEALRTAIVADPPAPKQPTLVAAPAAPIARRYHRGWWLMPGAAAAILLMYLGLSIPLGHWGARSETVLGPTPALSPAPVNSGPIHMVGQRQRQVDRNYYGITNQTGDTIYILEQRRTTTVEDGGGKPANRRLVEEY